MWKRKAQWLLLRLWLMFMWLSLVVTSAAETSAEEEASNKQDNHINNQQDTPAATTNVPNYWGCVDPVARALPYCNDSLTIPERVQDLRSRLTLAEKIRTLSPQKELGNTCMVHSGNISRVGLPQYAWLVETNTMVNSQCFLTTSRGTSKCATQFPGPLSVAASFNRSSWLFKGQVFGTEQRALMNIHARRTTGAVDYVGFTAYGPNINQQRDPRFGRSSELPGEDPFVAGQYAAHMVRGMQERDAAGYPKTLAYLKHFTAYSKEEDRGHDTYNISLFDLFDTYLPQYEMAFAQGHARGVMCSYNGINGVPLCANDFLLNQVLRKKWQQHMAHVTTDCGAVHYLLSPPALAPDNATSAAWALMNGTDLEMGSLQWTYFLEEAVERGLATEAAVDQAWTRSYTPHFEVGRFDDPAKSEWFQLGEDDIHSPHHQQTQLESALQGIVLLKHDYDQPLLPLTPGQQKVAVLGPLAHARFGLMSDYWGDEVCYGGGFECVPTLAESIRAVNPGHTTNATGVELADTENTAGIPFALGLGMAADVIVLVLGITHDQECEGLDRNDTALPGLQEMFAQQVFQIGKPVILVFVNGGQVAMDNLVGPAAVVIEAFNPNSIGGTALAKLLFDPLENRWGKLPYTIYPYETMQAFDMGNYEMAKPPGRTYRYYTGTPIYPFGYGLSLTRFVVDCHRPSDSPALSQAESIDIHCSVHNMGDYPGDEVVQVYSKAGTQVRVQGEEMGHPVPLLRLVAFERVRVDVGQSKSISFHLKLGETFALVNKEGEKVLYAGRHAVLVSNGVMEPIEFDVELDELDLANVE